MDGRGYIPRQSSMAYGGYMDRDMYSQSRGPYNDYPPQYNDFRRTNSQPIPPPSHHHEVPYWQETPMDWLPSIVQQQMRQLAPIKSVPAPQEILQSYWD